MYVDLSAWLTDFEHKASQENDTQRLQLVRGYNRAWNYIHDGAYDRALEHFEVTIAFAEKLQEHCWIIFLESNYCAALIYYQAEIQKALDRTIRVATRAYEPQFLHCPARAQLYCTLADIYSNVDWFSYLDEIRDLQDYIENEVPMDEDTHLRVRYSRAQLLWNLEEYDKAEEIVQQGLAQSYSNSYRMAHGNHLMMQIAYARGDLTDALAYAKEVERYARMPSIFRLIANALLSQAVVTYRLGEKDNSQLLLQRGLTEYERHDVPLRSVYYGTLSEYHELCGDFDKAQKFLEEYVEAAQSMTMIFQCLSHLSYCRFLGRLGKSLDEALTAARAITVNMKKPDLYLERLQRIENGDYHEFAWQKK